MRFLPLLLLLLSCATSCDRPKHSHLTVKLQIQDAIRRTNRTEFTVQPQCISVEIPSAFKIERVNHADDYVEFVIKDPRKPFVRVISGNHFSLSRQEPTGVTLFQVDGTTIQSKWGEDGRLIKREILIKRHDVNVPSIVLGVTEDLTPTELTIADRILSSVVVETTGAEVSH